MPVLTKMSLGEALRLALTGTLPEGWLYLASRQLSPDTPCLLAFSDRDEVEFDPLDALAAGFAIEGLDQGQLNQVATWTRQFGESPTTELLVESFRWYWLHDGFLPEPGAKEVEKDPEVWQLEQDRKFYDLLGEERPAFPCRRDACERGAIEFSVLCRAHHFSKMRGRDCPF